MKYILFGASSRSFTVVALAAKEVRSWAVQASRHPCRHQAHHRLALPAVKPFAGFRSASISFPQGPSLHLQRSSLEESQRSTQTERLRAVSFSLREKVPGHQFFRTALSATNRHRSAAFYHHDTFPRFVPLVLFSLRFLDAAGGVAGTGAMI